MSIPKTKSAKAIPITAAGANLRYTLKAGMRGAKPPIWRRLEVPGNITLERLMRVLLRAMGFGNSHLSAFIINGREYECYAEGGNPWEGGMSRSMRLKLSDLITTPKTKFQYLYDYGDGWEYAVEVEKIEPYPPESKKDVICITGKGAYLEDDTGGIWGYQNTIKILSDPEHEDYEEWKEMYGTLEEFVKPFDIDELNEDLKLI